MDITLFPIRVLAERTGVGTSTLRAWERRYGLLKPQRTPKGHRLYQEKDILLIQEVLKLLEKGHSISEVAKQILARDDSVQSSKKKPSVKTQETDTSQTHELASGQWAVYLERLISAVEQFNSQGLEKVYNEVSSLYPLDLVSRHLIEPALTLLGSRWNSRTTGIAEEHFFTAWLRNKLGARLHHAGSQAHGDTILVACVPGHRHEIGPLLFALAMLNRGLRVVYLGSDMPLDPLAEVVARCDARGVVLAGGRELDPETTISSLKQLLPGLACPLFVGGPLSVRFQSTLATAGVIPIGEQFISAVDIVLETINGKHESAESSATIL